MAAVSASNITNVTPRISGNKGQALNLGSQPMMVFRIASGQQPGDTAVLSSAEIPLIQAVQGPVTHNLPASGASSVTVTLAGFSGSTTVTTTIGAVDVWIVGPVATS